MKLIQKIFQCFLFLLLMPLLYLIVSLILTSISVNEEGNDDINDKSIYLNTNGIHLAIIMSKQNIDEALLRGIKHQKEDRYFSFAWGDKEFYKHTPTWEDLTLNIAFSALFTKSSTLMHDTRYRSKGMDWKEVKLSDAELKKLNTYILNSFKRDEEGMKEVKMVKGYTDRDAFYIAKGSYTCFYTCNTWVNMGFKESGLKSCLWTPFDFGLINKYE